jgi:hypothetical protein
MSARTVQGHTLTDCLLTPEEEAECRLSARRCIRRWSAPSASEIPVYVICNRLVEMFPWNGSEIRFVLQCPGCGFIPFHETEARDGRYI